MKETIKEPGIRVGFILDFDDAYLFLLELNGRW